MKFVVESPCVRNCCLNEEDVCLGCFRTLAEITRWTTVNDEIKKDILQKTELRRIDYQKKCSR